MAVNRDESDWTARFSSQSPKRRRIALTHAVGKIIKAETLASEKEISRGLLLAALEIDPNLVFDVLASVRGDGVSNDDIQRLKEEAAGARSNFNGLVNATQTLRTSLAEIGVMSLKDRLPETVDEWKAAIGKVVAKETHQLAVREARLQKQQEELEAKRKEALAEIEAAQNLSRIDIPSIDSKTNNLMDYIGAEVAGLFQQEVSNIVAGVAADVKGLILKRFVSLTDQAATKIAEAKGTIANLSFGYDQVESYEIGQLVADKGVYAGVWEPNDREGNPIGKKYNVFAAPEDLTDASGAKILLTFKATAKEVGKKKGWHHHNGLVIPDNVIDTRYEAYLYDILKNNDAYKGEWFIPTRDLLHGKNLEGNIVRPDDNLYALRNTGAFDGTFITTASGSASAHWYWSCTEHRELSGSVWNVDITDGDAGWNHEDNRRLSTRPVRVELVL